MKSSVAGIVLALTVLLSVTVESWGVSYTWTGAANTNWNNTGNWSPSSGFPNNSVNDTAIFTNAVTVNQPFVNANASLNTLMFATPTGGWTLSGSSSYVLTLGSGGIHATNQTSGTNMVTANLSLSSPSWKVGAGGVVLMTGTLSGTAPGTVGGAASDSGTLVLSGSNTFSGILVLKYGTLAINSTNALGSASLQFGTNLELPAFDNMSGAALTLTNNTPLNFNCANIIPFGGSSDLNMGRGAVTLSRSLNLNVVAGKLTLGGAIATNANTLTKSGSGVLVLTGVSGVTNVVQVNAGALQASEGVGLNTAALLKLNGGVLQGNGAASFTRALGTTTGTFQWMSGGGGFSAVDGQMTVNVGNDLRELTWGATVGTTIYGTLRLGSATANAKTLFQNPINLSSVAGSFVRVVEVPAGTGGDWAEMSGAIRNTGGTAGLVKTGAGTLYLSALNTYNGATTISNGILRVDGTLATGAVSVVSNATLSGTGTVAGLVTVAQGAMLVPGGDTGTMRIGTVAGQTNLVLNGTLLAAGSVSRGAVPWLSVTGNVALTSASNLSSTNLDLLPDGGTYTILAFTGSREGSFSSNSLPAGWQIIYSGTSSGTISIRKGYPGMILNLY